jgi:hypothetical protein
MFEVCGGHEGPRGGRGQEVRGRRGRRMSPKELYRVGMLRIPLPLCGPNHYHANKSNALNSGVKRTRTLNLDSQRELRNEG